MSNSNNGGNRGFTPRPGQTKKITCAYCKKNRGLKWTWHTWKSNFWGTYRWVCNSCP